MNNYRRPAIVHASPSPQPEQPQAPRSSFASRYTRGSPSPASRARPPSRPAPSRWVFWAPPVPWPVLCVSDTAPRSVAPGVPLDAGEVLAAGASFFVCAITPRRASTSPLKKSKSPPIPLLTSHEPRPSTAHHLNIDAAQTFIRNAQGGDAVANLHTVNVVMLRLTDSSADPAAPSAMAGRSRNRPIARSMAGPVAIARTAGTSGAPAGRDKCWNVRTATAAL